MHVSDTIRTNIAQSFIDDCGANATFSFYNGSRPANGGALSGNTLLATLTAGAVIGTAGPTGIALGAFTQNNTLHVSGTPTFVRVRKSDTTYASDLVVGQDVTVVGPVTPNLDVAMSGTVNVGNQS